MLIDFLLIMHYMEKENQSCTCFWLPFVVQIRTVCLVFSCDTCRYCKVLYIWWEQEQRIA
jgi:hypothetical protein